MVAFLISNRNTLLSSKAEMIILCESTPSRALLLLSHVRLSGVSVNATSNAADWPAVKLHEMKIKF